MTDYQTISGTWTRQSNGSIKGVVDASETAREATGSEADHDYEYRVTAKTASGKAAVIVNFTWNEDSQEQLVYAWHEHYGLPYTILRYDIPYGPRMRSNMAIDIFVRKAMRKQPITIYGEGNQGRCFIYVEDLADGNVLALKEKGKNQIFNLAGIEFITINQIVDQLREIFGKIEAVHDLKRAQDFKGVQVNIAKAKELLGWEPNTSFCEGLKKYIEYLRSLV